MTIYKFTSKPFSVSVKTSLSGPGTISASVSASSSQKPRPGVPDAFDPQSSNHQYYANLDNGTLIQASYSGTGSGSVTATVNGVVQAQVKNDLSNDMLQAQVSQGGWRQSTPRFQQHALDSCGPAVVSMLAASRAQVRSRDGVPQMQDLQKVSQRDGVAGSSPQEMGKMLAMSGLEVTRGVANTDPRLVSKLEQSLQRGDKIVALVDSDKIDAGGGTGQGGTAHWVLIDGKDQSTGNFLVKNPATGKDYYLSPQQLQAAFTGGEHKGGGFLAVTANTNDSQKQLTRGNREHAHVLGKTPGTGSKGGKGVLVSGT